MGSKIIEIFNKIAYNVLSALYQPFWAAVLLAFLAMFYIFMRKNMNGRRTILLEICCNMVESIQKFFKFSPDILISFLYSNDITPNSFNREIWFDPLGKLFGGWGLYEEGQFTTESIENFMLFVPFSILLLWTFQKELLDESENIRFGKTVWEATKLQQYFRF